jgi:four helix bundle protein
VVLTREILDCRLQIADLIVGLNDFGTPRASSSGMNPKEEALKARTKRFALDILEFVETFPSQGPSFRICLQLVDAATSVGANYRAACRGRSRAEFAAKIGQVLEESDESLFWLEIADARKLGPASERSRLLQEANELTAIFAASAITVRLNSANERSTR